MRRIKLLMTLLTILLSSVQAGVAMSAAPGQDIGIITHFWNQKPSRDTVKATIERVDWERLDPEKPSDQISLNERAWECFLSGYNPEDYFNGKFTYLWIFSRKPASVTYLLKQIERTKKWISIANESWKPISQRLENFRDPKQNAALLGEIQRLTRQLEASQADNEQLSARIQEQGQALEVLQRQLAEQKEQQQRTQELVLQWQSQLGAQSKRVSAVEGCWTEFSKINKRLEELGSTTSDVATSKEDSETIQKLQQQINDLQQQINGLIKSFEEVQHELSQSDIETIEESLDTMNRKLDSVIEYTNHLKVYIGEEQAKASSVPLAVRFNTFASVTIGTYSYIKTTIQVKDPEEIKRLQEQIDTARQNLGLLPNKITQ